MGPSPASHSMLGRTLMGRSDVAQPRAKQRHAEAQLFPFARTHLDFCRILTGPGMA
jgi:hypothetical protein